MAPSKISFKRHLAKTVTWRILASLTTYLLAIFFFEGTENAQEKAITVALIESFFKMLFYYFHERIWIRINLKVASISSKRHFIKTITWRLIASLTTFLIALFIFKEDSDVMEKAYGLMIAETVIKMAIYYLHERIWYKSKFGINN